MLLILCAALPLFAAESNRVVTIVVLNPEPTNNATTGTTVYRFKHTRDLSQPFTLLAQTTETALAVNVIEGVNFFTVTASNFWGESPPSEMAITPPKLTPPSLRISLTQ